MCAPCSNEPTCGPKGLPPHKSTSLIFGTLRASLRISLPTWSANSRVGQSTKACVPKKRGLILSNKPMPNAAVLPLPVFACAIMSLPFSMCGKLCACTGVIFLYPNEVKFLTCAGEIGSDEKAELDTVIYFFLVKGEFSN